MADLKLDTLIKVLLMTTSDNNSESLAAIRRANVMLRNANTDWEKLLRGKVTVVADPFADIPAPSASVTTHTNSRPTVPSRPQPAYDVGTPYVYPQAPAYTRTKSPPQTPPYSPQAARKNNTNNFVGNCFNCDTYTPAGYGALRDINSKIHVFCEDCNFKISNGSLSISTLLNNNYRHKLKQAQTKTSYSPRVKRKVTTKDLMSDIFQPATPSQDDDITF